MGFHGCPIEPNDWTDGPDYLEGDDCEHCGGTGFEDEDAGVTCEHCEGQGVILHDYEPWDDDVI